MKVIIYADGGSRGNPGVAGSGTVVYADDGSTVLREIAYVVGKKATNNVAEYHGLLRGVEAAAELGATEVEMHMDSKLVVEQINGRWKIKHPDMQELALRARKIIVGFEAFSLDWVPRAKNKVADALSNDAMDACASGHPVGIVGGDDGDDDNGGAPEVESDAAADSAADAAAEPADWMPERGTVTRFVLLRHGQTDFSARKLYCGHSDPKLTDLGEKQALAAAQALVGRGIDAIVSSPLQRCRATAQAASAVLGVDVDIVDGLIELDFGDWEGKTYAQAHDADPELHSDWLIDPAVECPGGESLQQLHRRMRTTRQQLCRDYAGKTVLVVSHVNPIKSLMRQALDAGPATFNRMFLDLASISDVEFYDGGSMVRGFNDVGHLGSLQ